MTDNKTRITPPPELLQQWAVEYWGNPGETIGEGEKYIAIQAARWGADQELKACCEWIGSEGLAGYTSRELRAARRPKPKSQAEKALASLDGVPLPEEAWQAVSAALERLRELESNQ